MAQIKANEALVKALQTWNIDHLYGIPGDSVDAVVDSLRTVRDQFSLSFLCNLQQLNSLPLHDVRDRI